MKNIFKFLAITALLFTGVSCDYDAVVNNTSNFAQLSDASSATILENSGDVVTITVILGSPQDTDTTINFDVSGTANASRYLLSSASIVVPVGETSGTIELSAIDNDDIDGDVDVTLTLSTTSSLPVGIAGEGINSLSKTILIIDDNLPCNDYVLIVLTDAFPQETTWEVTDSNGAVVVSGGEDYGPPSSAESRLKEYVENFTLEDGCYTFTISDAFGDGLADGVVEGSWNLSCGAIIASTGVGDFGFSSSTDFCVNQ